MHDLTEGIIPAILEQILTMIASKYSLDLAAVGQQRSISASKKILEESFKKYDFYEGQPHLVWQSSPRNGYKIDGTAIQVKTKNFYLFFSFNFCIFTEARNSSQI